MVRFRRFKWLGDARHDFRRSITSPRGSVGPGALRAGSGGTVSIFAIAASTCLGRGRYRDLAARILICWAGMLIMAGIGLFPSSPPELGRAWCGFMLPARRYGPTCFQHIDRLIEAGIAMPRARLRQGRRGPHPRMRGGCPSVRSILVISMATGGAWILYFADAPTLFVDFFTGGTGTGAYMTVGHPDGHDLWLGGSCANRCASTCAPGRASRRAMARRKIADRPLQGLAGEPRGSAEKGGQEPRSVRAAASIACNVWRLCPPRCIDIREGQQISAHHLRLVHRCLRLR